jgi:hypothetical protein
MTEPAPTARQMWTLFEPVHIISYFAAEPRAEFEKAGVRGYWRGYFAGRAAPLGHTAAAPVIASFFSFAPAMVSRALPGVWEMISPQDALGVRAAGAAAALRTLLGLASGQTAAANLAQAADLLVAATDDIEAAGRPLGAANAALPMPAEPLARLWQAATVLREHRGDGHVAALVAADLDGSEALALRVGVDLAAGGAHSSQAWGWTRQELQPIRGWTDADWDAATQRLAGRGLLSSDGTATTEGVAVHRGVERATDVSAARPWARLGASDTARLAELLEPVAAACGAALPRPGPASALTGSSATSTA